MKFSALLQFETKKYLRICLIFSIVWMILIFLFMGFFDSISQNADQLTKLYASFPKELLDAFGKSLDSISSIYGYFGVQIMTYLFLSGGIFTVSISSNSLSGEINNRNLLFLLSKPISRVKIYLGKIAAIIIGLLVSNILLFGATLSAIKILTKVADLDLKFFVLIYLALFIFELFFLGVTELLGAKLVSGKVSTIGLLMTVVTYLLNILSGLSAKAASLKYLSPFYYLDLNTISQTHTLKPEGIFLVVIAAGLILLGAYFFQQRDLN